MFNYILNVISSFQRLIPFNINISKADNWKPQIPLITLNKNKKYRMTQTAVKAALIWHNPNHFYSEANQLISAGAYSHWGATTEKIPSLMAHCLTSEGTWGRASDEDLNRQVHVSGGLPSDLPNTILGVFKATIAYSTSMWIHYFECAHILRTTLLA